MMEGFKHSEKDQQTIRDHGISRLHRYLVKKLKASFLERLQKNEFLRMEFVADITLRINAIFQEHAEPDLLQLLDNYGWDDEMKNFRNAQAPVDFESLKFALGKLLRKLHVDTSKKADICSANCFIPDILLNHMQARKNLGAELAPFSVMMTGVCLLVDISGFTRMSGGFYAQGKDGIDSLQLVTNGFMGQLVDIIYAHGGDIIKFAGDALVCLFSYNEGVSTTAADGQKGIVLTELRKECTHNEDEGQPKGHAIELDPANARSKRDQGCSSLCSSIQQRDDDSHERTEYHPKNAKLASLRILSSVQEANEDPHKEHGHDNDKRHLIATESPRVHKIRSTDTSVGSNNSTTIAAFLDTMKGFTAESRKERNRLIELVLRATRCALEVKDISVQNLTVHVGMSCGDICFAVLGGHKDRWDCLISGACIFELSQCLDDASSGEVTITKDCHDLIQLSSGVTKHRLMFQSLSSGNYLLQDKEDVIPPSSDSKDEAPVAALSGAAAEIRVPISDLRIDTTAFASTESTTMTTTPSSHESRVAVLRQSNGTSTTSPKAATTPLFAMMRKTSDNYQSDVQSLINLFVPQPIIEGFDHGGLAYLGEIREVTTMFMKWDSFEAGSKHKDLLSLQDCFYAAQQVLGENGGFMRQFLVDDKGCVLIACWGVPTASYLDNAYRALASAVGIRDKLRRMSMQCSFGITTGNVYCGTVGSPVRAEYTVIGDVVNMSARLMWKANGNVYFDEATFDRLPFSVHGMVQRLPPMMVKGRATPLTVHWYASPHLLHISELEIEDCLVRDDCKRVLLQHLEQLIHHQGNSSPKFIDRSPKHADNANDKNPPVEGVVAGGAMNWTHSTLLSRAASVFSTSQTQPMASVLLEGREGAGKNKTINWFSELAASKGVQVRSISLGERTNLLPFHALALLFREFIGPDEYDNVNRQRQAVIYIIRQIYGANTTEIESTVFPAMQIALGITCAPPSNACGLPDKEGGPSTVRGISFTPNSKRFSTGSKLNSLLRVTPDQVIAVILKIFSFLLNEHQPTLLTIENLHFADSLSLQCLGQLQNLPCKAIAVFTAITSEEANKKARIECQTKKCPRQALKDWKKNYRNQVCDNTNCTLITLDSLTVDEIDRMANRLFQANGQYFEDERGVPRTLASLVHRLSGGDFFWVKEMLEFVKSTGPERFLASMEDLSYTTEDKLSPRRMKRISDSNLSNLSNASSSNVGSGTIVMDNLESEKNKTQLENFLVCRMERLSPDQQKIIRAASVIGWKFSRYTLSSILPAHLQEHLSSCLTELLRLQWIREHDDTAGKMRGILTGDGDNYAPELSAGSESINRHECNHFCFVHPLMQKTLYSLTPASDRSNLHRQIAEYMEELSPEDPESLSLLSRHYKYFNADKAFEYCIRSACTVFSKAAFMDMPHFLTQIAFSFQFIESVQDAEFILTVLEHGRDKYVTMDGVNSVASRNTNRHIRSSKKESIVRSPNHVSSDRTLQQHQKQSHRRFSWLSCLGCAYNDVVPLSITHHHERAEAGRSSSRISSRSTVSDLSEGVSVVSGESMASYMSHTVSFMNTWIMELQNDLLKFMEMLTRDGKFCSLRPHWQTRVLKYLDRCACEDGIDYDMSCAASSVGWTAAANSRSSPAGTRRMTSRTLRLLT